MPASKAEKFPKQENNGWAWEHPRVYTPLQQLKKVSISVKEIHRWARSYSGLKMNSNVRALESIFILIDEVTSAAPHPNHVVAMIQVHEALAILLSVLPKNLFPFRLQDFAPVVDELCTRKDGSFSARFENTLHDLRSSIKSGLQLLKTMILDYASEAVPQGGGIHEITKYLMKYIMLLLDHGSSLSIILVSDEQEGATSIEGSTLETLQVIVAALMSHLETMLEKESCRYQDAGLQHMFLVNNVHFVLHQVEGSEIRYLLGDDWVLKYRSQLKQYISCFINISWESVMYCFQVKTSKALIFSSLPTLERFNLEFERTYQTQKTWKVEHPLLRLNMRKAVSKKLVPTYSSYLENHQNKPPKLMKYTPEDLEKLLSELFEG